MSAGSAVVIRTDRPADGLSATPQCVASSVRSFEKHFDHFIAMALNHLELHAARENSRILPLMVRLSSLKGKSAV